MKTHVTYLKIYFNENLIKNEVTLNKIINIFTNISNEVSNIINEKYQTRPNNKYAMVKIQFPNHFPKVYAKKATYRALSKYGKIIELSTIQKQKPINTYISRNANHPTLHYVLMELNSISLTPPKDYISFVNGDRTSKHLSVPYDRGLLFPHAQQLM